MYDPRHAAVGVHDSRLTQLEVCARATRTTLMVSIDMNLGEDMVVQG